nr:uncharacterized protein LOC109165051 [Ipomoea batatas]
MRWLTIAEKLLANRDLMGSKSFATRAQESDPTMVHGEQILAVIDTLIAGDKLMNNQFDWYGILQVPPNQAHDSEFIATQYRRLALLLNPQKNNFPFADQAFRLVLDAWNLLSNPFRKNVYDKELGFFINLNPNPVPSVQQQQQPPSAFSVVPNSGRDQQQQMFFVSREQQQPFTTGQPLTFLSREPVQTVTFLQQPNTGRDQQPPPPPQPVTFLSRDPPPPVTSVPSLNVDQLPTVAYMPGSSSEPQPFSFTPSSVREGETGLLVGAHRRTAMAATLLHRQLPYPFPSPLPVKTERQKFAAAAYFFVQPARETREPRVLLLSSIGCCFSLQVDGGS